jgi:hypothetical protein
MMNRRCEEMEMTRQFVRERETKRMVVFDEIIPEGATKMIGKLYVNKEIARKTEVISVTINTDVKNK